MVANRYKCVRAALCLNENMAKLSREHNNANVLVLGSRLISYKEAIKCFIMFLNLILKVIDIKLDLISSIM